MYIAIFLDDHPREKGLSPEEHSNSILITPQAM